MTDALILHHYDNSPYAEKIRLMFGLTGATWQSVRCPAMPPRPSLDPLTGGYRRIPVVQIGADLFCDTALIARELAVRLDCPALDPATADDEASRLMTYAEDKAFFAAIGAVPPVRLIGSMLKLFGPIGTVRFIKDRVGLMKGASVAAPSGDEAKTVIDNLLTDLDRRLESYSWVGGSTASVADFAVYHPLWLHVTCMRRSLDTTARVNDWYERVGDIAQGNRIEATETFAFDTARNSQPRALPHSIEAPSIALGEPASVTPADYGKVPVTGRLAAVTPDRFILERRTDDFGVLHVHFPRPGYLLSKP